MIEHLTHESIFSQPIKQQRAISKLPIVFTSLRQQLGLNDTILRTPSLDSKKFAPFFLQWRAF